MGAAAGEWGRDTERGDADHAVVFFMHQEKLDEDWFLLIDELKAPPQQARPYVVEELPDTNLLKQAVEKCKNQRIRK